MFANLLVPYGFIPSEFIASLVCLGDETALRCPKVRYGGSESRKCAQGTLDPSEFYIYPDNPDKICTKTVLCINDNPFLNPRAIRKDYKFITQYKDGEKTSKVRYAGIAVSYLPRLDGGGRDFGQDFIPIVREKLGKVGKVCEFGSGPGFIGFSLLANGLCDSLSLIDINPEAIKFVRKTIRENGLEDKVSVYLSDGLKKVPSTERWDLVVSNPPHFGGSVSEWGGDMRIFDPDWSIHKDFYRMVKKFLNDNGSVIFVENGMGSKAGQWRKLAVQNGLEWVESFKVGKLHGMMRQARTVIHTIQRVDGKKMKEQMGGAPRTLMHIPKNLYYVVDYIIHDPFYFVWSRKGCA